MSNTDALADYISYPKLKALSEATIKKSRHTLRAFFRFLGLEPSQVSILSTSQIRGYVASLQERGLADKTLAEIVKTIKTFCRFLLEEGYLEKDPSERIPVPKVGRRLPQVLTKEEIRRLFRAMAGGTKIDRRNKVLFHLLYSCGLRIGEAVRSRIEDVDLEGGTLRVIGKGDKERRLFLRPTTVTLLRKYIEQNDIVDFLFPSREGGHVAIGTMDYQFQRYVKRAGFKKRVTPHTLRHSVAVHYLVGGAPISFVQDLLGHANLSTMGI